MFFISDADYFIILGIFVITSYSIHYTKLYETNDKQGTIMARVNTVRGTGSSGDTGGGAVTKTIRLVE